MGLNSILSQGEVYTMKALLKLKTDEGVITLGRLTDEPCFYILNDLSNDMLYTELRAIQDDVRLTHDFDLDEYIKYYVGKLYFEKEN